MALAGTLGLSVDMGNPWGWRILRQGGPTPTQVDLISLPLASSSLMAVWILWRMCDMALLASCPHPRSRQMLTVPMAALWVWIGKLRQPPGVCIIYVPLLIPFLGPSITCTQELPVPWHPSWLGPAPEPFYPAVTEICLLWTFPALLVPYPCFALCYNALHPQQKMLTILTLALIEKLICSDSALILLHKFFHLILRKFYKIDTIIISTS